MTDPIVKSITVPVPVADAFEVFTSHISRWWPGHDHSVSASQGAKPQDIVFEQKTGGAIYEIQPDGTRSDWGVVQHWTPPDGFSMTWHPGGTADRATLVTLEFQAVKAGTKVTLTHTGWEVLGNSASDTAHGYDSGWDYVLGECFGGAF
ncbi:MAG: SRPBCC domain-containing protein [Rhodobacteraceae bacterium]|nr:SRPBCC domain-containing protein [Paracoccaceae bacterium]